MVKVTMVLTSNYVVLLMVVLMALLVPFEAVDGVAVVLLEVLITGVSCVMFVMFLFIGRDVLIMQTKVDDTRFL